MDLTVEDLIRAIERQIEQEKDMSNRYLELSKDASELGYPNMAAGLRRMAEGNRLHCLRLEQMARTTRSLWSGGFKELPRLFPKTYGEWVDLAIDIKERDPSLSDEVNKALDEIQKESFEANNAKRWLAKKAWDLGIK